MMAAGFPIILVAIYAIFIFGGIAFTIYAVLRYLSLKSEQNDILRDVVRHLREK